MVATKTFSEIQETKISESLGWKRVSGSGARACLPGDVEGLQWLGECKTHTKRIPKIQFNYAVWLKINEEATSRFKRPVLFVDDGSQLLEYTWCVIPACSHPGAAVLPPPISINYSNRTNLSFAGNALRKHLYDTPVGAFDDRYIKTTWQGKEVHILRFRQFANWFGEL